MSEEKWLFGDVEWRFLPGKTFDLGVTKLRCRGYPVMQGGKEIAFVCLRHGSWYVVRPGRTEGLKAFDSRQAAIDSLKL
jgi:hypothetical protein